MATLYISHPSGLIHLTPPGHPERPDRLRAVEAAMEAPQFQALKRVQAPTVPLETIALCHPMEYVEAIREAVPDQGMVRIDSDTSVSSGSFEAVLHAIGGAVHAVDEVMAGNATNAFCAVRPPGHHAETARAMGFCLFNTAAIAARHAQEHRGAERVAVVDFDVHHGNGSQDIFWADQKVMYCSTHQMPLFPGTGARSESGVYENIVNAPLRAGDNGPAFRVAFETTILPRLRNFQPDLVVISAGFDAHRRDPLANLNLDDTDFAWVTQKLMDIADRTASGRIVSVLEGGYDLEGLQQSAAAHVSALMQG